MLAVLFFALTFSAHAQTTDARSTSVVQGAPGAEASSRKAKKKDAAADVSRMQRRMSMNPDEAKRDQQMDILAARAGTSNTSFGRATGPARQFEKGKGGFTVRKFKDKRMGTARQKRGQTRPAPGIDPKGKPLVHKHKKKRHFLFF